MVLESWNTCSARFIVEAMIVLTKTGGVAATNSFLIADEATNQAVLFDAPDHTVAPLLDEAGKRGLDLIGLWLTHGHFDHFADRRKGTVSARQGFDSRIG
jgi:glyoxylase-like metal-dependent hydrolase (beta-lactamase superfamily II)